MTELNDKQLNSVSGGNMIDIVIMPLLHDLGLNPKRELVEELISKGGSTLRNWAKAQTGNDKRCNIIPEF